MDRAGQSTLEAVMILVIFVMAFLVMQGYFRRSVQANLRSNIDSFSDEQFSVDQSSEAGLSGVQDPSCPGGVCQPGALVFTDTIVTSDTTYGNLLNSARNDGIIQASGWGIWQEGRDD